LEDHPPAAKAGANSEHLSARLKELAEKCICGVRN
jgi:hypothetical protein